MTTQIPDADLIDQWLERYLLIGAVAPGIGNVQKVGKYLWELPSGPFPMLIFNLRRLTPERTTGQPFYRMTVDFNIRHLGGPKAQGAAHQAENNINLYVFGVLNHFMRYRGMETPDSSGNPSRGTEFKYIEDAQISVGSPITEFLYGDPNNQTAFLGMDLIHEFTIFTRRQ